MWLHLVVRGRTPALSAQPVGRGVGVALGAAGVACAAMWAVERGVDLAGRAGSLVEVVAAGAVGAAVYLGASTALRGPRPATLVGLLRGAGG